jgi:hypothetical protein
MTYSKVNNKKFKVAIIGAGFMAQEHIKVFKAIKEIELCGIYSRTKVRAQEVSLLMECGFAYDSISELYEKSKPDLVIICVSELSLFEVCKEVFTYPWMCLIEKPVGYDLEEARKILNCANQYNQHPFVALNRRHYSSTRTIIQDIAGDSMPRLIHIMDQEDLVAAEVAGKPKLVLKNWMYANSIHLIDCFNLFARGNVLSVDRIIPWTPEAPWLVMAKITYDSGDIGFYEAIWNGPGPWAVSVSSQLKRWEMRPMEQCAIQIAGSRVMERVTIDSCDINFKPGLFMQAKESVKALMGLPHLLPTLGDVMKSMVLVGKIYEEG